MRAWLLVGVVMGGLLSALTPAAGQPVAPAYSWTGFYIGGNFGHAWGTFDVASQFFQCRLPGFCPYSTAPNPAAFSAAGTGDFSQGRYHGGVQGGFNWQSRNVVMGVEVDLSAFRLKRVRSVVGPTIGGEGGNNFVVITAAESKWVFTARGRLGWTIIPTALLYATGGVAVTDLAVSNAFEDDALNIIGNTANTAGASNFTQRKVGWTIGGGMEWALLANWTLKAEYLYFDLGSVSTTAYIINPGVPFDDPNVLRTSVHLHARMARIGLNFRFAP